MSSELLLAGTTYGIHRLGQVPAPGRLLARDAQENRLRHEDGRPVTAELGQTTTPSADPGPRPPEKAPMPPLAATKDLSLGRASVLADELG